MTDNTKKPSERVLNNPYDGKEVKDKLGRTIKLRKPNILDKYDLMSAMADDAKNPMCLSYAIPLLHVLSIDGVIVECPKSFREFRATLMRFADEGMEAVTEFMGKVEQNNISEKEVTDSLKK